MWEQFRFQCTLKSSTARIIADTDRLLALQYETDEMIKIVDENNLVCQIELEMHYNPVIARLKELVKNGEIGKIKSFNATNITLSPVWAFPWQGCPEKSYGKRVPIKEGHDKFRGGALCDHPHIFDLIR